MISRLVPALLVFAVLVLAGELRWPVALAAVAMLAALTLAMPRRAALPDGGAAAGAAREAELAAAARGERELVRRLPDPLLVLGPGGAVVRKNVAADRLGGLSATLRHPELRGALDRAEAEGRVQEAELRFPGREVAATVIPLNPPLADGGTVAAVLSDRTRERAVERMRSDFVANASHELRTPLAVLVGFIDTLQGPAADDKPAQARFLAIMAEQAGRMNRLIDDLLTLSRIEMTEHQAPGEPVDLAPLLRRMVAALETVAAARGVKLKLLVAGELPAVAGDADQLEQVAQNLLDNAIKYGRDTGTVRVSLRSGEARPGVVLTVSDDGPGIAREHIPRLTERFYRADKHRSRAVGGTGLGLAIVKHVINRHRGTLGIESREGVGTTVTVWLPPAGPETGGGATA